MLTIILIISVLHAYFFAVLFFLKKQLSKSMLGLYMVNFFIKGGFMVNFYTFSIPHINLIFYLLFFSILLLDFPFMYMYVKIMVEKNFKWKLKTYGHFLPALSIFLVQLTLFLFLPLDAKKLLYEQREVVVGNPALKLFFTPYSISIIILFVQVIVYSSLMVIKLVKHSKNIESHYSYKHNISLKWLYVFVVFYILYYISESLFLTIDAIRISEEWYITIVSLHIFFIGIMGYRQKDIYRKEIVDKEKSYTSKTEVEETINKQGGLDLSKAIDDKVIEDFVDEDKKELLSQELREELAEKIKYYLIEEKMYLDPELSLDNLVEKMNLHKNYISYVINHQMGTNFYSIVNKYRVEAAKEMLSNPEYDNLSIEGVATKVGFKSRNVFYPIFKKFTDTTPFKYRKMFQNK